MSNFTTRDIFLIPSFTLDLKEEEKLYQFLTMLEKSNVSSILKNEYTSTFSKGGRPPYRGVDMLSTILYGFAFNRTTLRDLEDACKYDLRYIYLMEQSQPSYVAFGDFINNYITPNIDKIFKLVTMQIIKEIGIDIDEVFIDGTKFEANANKYKFVWKPTKFHEKLSDKIRKLLKELDLHRNIEEKGIIESKIIAKKLTELSRLSQNNDKYIKPYNTLLEYLTKALEYEEKERICGDRNSYYKTDHDATAMCLKRDYYAGLGSNMHAAYNTQIAVSKGLIIAGYVSQSRNDYKDFIPILNKVFQYYDKYPKIVCADSGYGSYDNYKFLNDNNINNYVKYYSWQGNKSGRNPDKFYLNENHTITCLNGNEGKITEIEGRHPRYAKAVYYKVEGCHDCQFASYCKNKMKDKESNERIFEINEDLYFYKQEAEKNLLSIKGIELRVNRSAQVEGAYGVIKQDMQYTRLRRTSIEKVKTELLLTFLGYNIRKYFKFLSGKAKFVYWSAPENLQPATFKKPSAIKLTNKINKKSVNEQARKYNYK